MFGRQRMQAEQQNARSENRDEPNNVIRFTFPQPDLDIFASDLRRQKQQESCCLLSCYVWPGSHRPSMLSESSDLRRLTDSIAMWNKGLFGLNYPGQATGESGGLG